MAIERPAGKLPFFIRRRLGFLARAQYCYDDVVRLRWGEQTYMLTHPADIRHVLVSRAANYIKTPQLTGPQGRSRAGEGLLTSTGAAHQWQRQLMQPVFRRRSVARFANVVVDRTEKMLAGWSQGDAVDMAREMAGLTQAIIVGTLFGMDFEDEGGQLAAAILARRKYTEYLYHSPLPFRTRLPTRPVRDYGRAMAQIDAVIEEAIRLRRRAEPGDDLASMLLEAAYPDGSTMDDRQVRDEILTLITTGYETVGDALAWTFYLLARHPGVEERFWDELDQILGAGAIGSDEVAKLRYTEMVFAESLRLYPPTWIYVRVPLETECLPSGATVAAGAKLYLCQYVMHRHPRYFPQPERFDPERFADPVERQHLRDVYFPFGAGPHRCIGEMFARLEGALVLAMVAQRFRFRLQEGRRVRPWAGITLRPAGGLHGRLSRRR